MFWRVSHWIIISTKLSSASSASYLLKGSLVKRLKSLSQDAQRLYVRLSGRRGPLFRVDKLVYPEILNLDLAIDDLLGIGLFEEANNAQALDLLALLTKQDLLLHFDGLDKKRTRGDLLELILSENNALEIRQCLKFRIVAPMDLADLCVYKLLFFGNLHQDFSEFVLRDLGISPFENYSMEASARYFDSREMLLRTLDVYALEAACYDVLELADAGLLIAFSDEYLAKLKADEPRIKRRISKLQNRVARELERHEEALFALKIYELSGSSPSRERQARIHAKLKNISKAMRLCQNIYEAPLDEAEFEFAAKFDGRFFFTPKKMGAQTSEANINAGIAGANQIIGYINDGVDTCKVNK